MGTGPALGIYQMELATYDYLWDDYLERRDDLKQKVMKACDITAEVCPVAERMIWDLRFATLMARLKYWTIPEAIPKAEDLLAIAEYYVKYYNAGGKATIEKFLENYKKFVINEI